jgi:hypothetical protein
MPQFYLPGRRIKEILYNTDSECIKATLQRKGAMFTHHSPFV